MHIRGNSYDYAYELFHSARDEMITNQVDTSCLYLNAYELERCYGGPEEGGWWFDSGTPVLSYWVGGHPKDLATALQIIYSQWEEAVATSREYTSVLGGLEIEVRLEDHPAKYFPEETPRYE